MRYALIGFSMLLGSVTAITPATAEVSVSVSIPGVSIGINQPTYPELVQVPGYPVYYAPDVQANYFFYDGLYWVYQGDNWYTSAWYNGPWDLVEPDDVPLFVLRVPVRYYMQPPVYFHGWVVTASPLWHYHWGPRWTRYHHGWDHWDRRVVYAPAPLPVYQRHYHGDRYPQREYQRVIRHEHYHYQPRDQVVRRHDQRQATPRPQRHAQPNRPDISREQRPQREREDVRRPEPREALPQQRGPVAHEQRQPQRQRQEAERPTPAPVQQAPQGRPDVPRPQRQREETQGSNATQRAAARAQRAQPAPAPQPAPRVQQAPRPQQAPRAQQAPRPQQAPRAQEAPRPQQAPRPQFQTRGPQGGGEASQSRGNAERRQGPQRGGGQAHP